MMYRVSDLVVMGCVLDLFRDVMGSIKRGHPEGPWGIPNLILASALLIETTRRLFFATQFDGLDTTRIKYMNACDPFWAAA